MWNESINSDGIGYNNNMKTKSGFTIVELLIVIVIIGILAAITIVAYNGIQTRARDNVRKADIANLAKGIELYYAANGNYPMSAGWCTQYSGVSYLAAFTAELEPYMKNIPLDPLYKQTYQDYFYQNIGDTSYYLYAELEGEDRADDGLTGCARTGGLDNEYDYRYRSF